MRTRFLTIAAATAVLAAASAAPASAEIIVNQSVAGVSVGMSQDEVIGLLGDPDRSVTNPAFDTIYTYRGRGLRVTFAPNGDTNDVTTVEVRGRAERTASGVGVGSTLRQLRAGVSGVKCVRAPNRKHRWCSKRTRSLHTTFVVSSKRKVLSIVFGRRGD